ncbi:beta-ketoacyl-ACP synthase II [Bdellovibrionota bacterium FG-2]
MSLNTSLRKRPLKFRGFALMSSQSTRRVVITGLGAVTPLGLTACVTWENALKGTSGVGPITLFDTTDCPIRIAAEVRGFDVGRELGPFYPRGADSPALTQAANSKEARRVGRYVHFALAAGLEAYGDSGLDLYRDKIAAERMGVNIGVGMGGLPEIEEVHNDFLAKGYRRVTPFFIPQVISNMAAGQLSIALNLRGPNLCNVTACTSSAHSLGESLELIRRGTADVMFAGGAEAVLCKLGVAGFASMRALSSRNEEPTRASRPFDMGRDGFVMGEGSVVLVLEELEHARRRGAKIYAELAGYGLSGDAYHMTTPSPEGEGGGRSIKMALEDAGLSPEQVGYVNAHGTSTPAGDTEEAVAIAKVVASGSRTQGRLNVSSTKSMTGHLLGAAGALEAMFCVNALRHGIIPPTINLETLDPSCASLGIDFTANRACEKKISAALSNSFGFGGTNATLAFKRI